MGPQRDREVIKKKINVEEMEILKDERERLVTSAERAGYHEAKL